MATTLTKTMVAVLFGEQEQKRGAKIRMQGQLANAQDVIQRKTGVYRQRNGSSALNTTTDTGSIATANGLAASSGSPVLQTADTIFARSSTQSKWINKGAYAPGFMSWSEIVPNFGTRPTSLSDGVGNTWTFTYNKNDSCWYLLVTEDATGVTIYPLAKLATVTDSNLYGWARPVLAGGFIWLFHMTNSTANLSVAKFTVGAPATAPTVSVYYNHTTNVGGTLRGFDVMQTSTANRPIVATYGSTGAVGLTFLDTATSAPKGIPGIVVTAPVSANSGAFLRGGDGSNGSFYYVGDANLLTLNATNLTTTTTDALGGMTTSATGSVCGFWDGTNKNVLYTDNAPGGPVDLENSKITLASKPAGAATYTVFARASYAVTSPFKVGSTWYVVTGHDDNLKLQCALYLRNAATGKILARTLYQLGGDTASRGAFNSSTTNMNYCWTTPDPVVSGTTATFPGLANMSGTTDYATCAIVVETSPALAGLVTMPSGDQVRIPGGWPAEVSVNAPLIEQAPPMYPRAFVSMATNGTVWTAGTYGFALVYAEIDPAGNMCRSAPCPTFTQVFGGAQGPHPVVPTLRTTNAAAGQSYIEIYATLPGGVDLFLVKTIPNDPTVDSIDVPFILGPTYGELIYTSGGILSHTPPPPYRSAAIWKNRKVITDTDVPGEIWPSDEIQAGQAVTYNETAIVRVPGRQRAVGVVDENYLAAFMSDGISVLYGQGLSDAGTGGNFATLRLPWTLGTTNPASIVTGPQGCYFQAIDGGIYLLSRDLQVVYVGAGVDDHRTATVTAAIHVPKERHMRFYLNSGKCLVLDYGNVESNPLGKWYVFTGQSAVAAAVIGDAAYFVTSAGAVWHETDGQFFDGTNTPILPKIQVATISFSGLNGYQILYRGLFLGEYKGAHSIQITTVADFNGTPQVFGPRVVSGAPEEFEFSPAAFKLTALDVTIERVGTDVTDCFTFEGLAFEVGSKGALRAVNVAQQL